MEVQKDFRELLGLLNRVRQSCNKINTSLYPTFCTVSPLIYGENGYLLTHQGRQWFLIISISLCTPLLKDPASALRYQEGFVRLV